MLEQGLGVFAVLSLNDTTERLIAVHHARLVAGVLSEGQRLVVVLDSGFVIAHEMEYGPHVAVPVRTLCN